MDKKRIGKLSRTEFNRKRYRRTALKVEDEVIVIAGKEKGKRGKILYIDRLRDRVYVQGVNKMKRYVRPSQENPQGGQVEIEAPLHISNVMFYDAKAKKGVRIGYEMRGEKKVRVTRPGGREI